VGQLGIVLPADNPLRIAEDIAMLDHMTGGRANAGFARGYQRRWVDVMAQHTHGVHGVAPHQHDAVDAANRDAFEENFRIIKRCWTEDMLQWQGKLWRIPVEGTPWTVEASSKYGKGIENGIVRAVGVVPKPVQKPHPPLFQPFASSESSIRWCAQEGVTAVLPPMHAKHETRLTELYAAESGRRAGDGVAFLRDIVIADSDAEADHLWQESSRFMAQAWFEPFGFRRLMIDPDTKAAPTPQEMIDLGYVLVGTVDTVCRRFESMLKRLPVEWIFFWAFNGLVSNAAILRTLERWQTQVLPKLGLA
jgi:alkanesulfonate monooxygenase SsuD/methylene tetrahydromethanopterin reductase-like flavin-dependent oxidoreductase (luciferase family)